MKYKNLEVSHFLLLYILCRIRQINFANSESGNWSKILFDRYFGCQAKQHISQSSKVQNMLFYQFSCDDLMSTFHIDKSDSPICIIMKMAALQTRCIWDNCSNMFWITYGNTDTMCLKSGLHNAADGREATETDSVDKTQETKAQHTSLM